MNDETSHRTLKSWHWSGTDVARRTQLAPPRVILLCAYQLIKYDVLDVIRTPTSRAKFAEHTARLEQLGTLLVREL
jgi:hypothetical protein